MFLYSCGSVVQCLQATGFLLDQHHVDRSEKEAARKKGYQLCRFFLLLNACLCLSLGRQGEAGGKRGGSVDQAPPTEVSAMYIIDQYEHSEGSCEKSCTCMLIGLKIIF